MIVVLTNGRLAGKKAIVLEIIDDQYILVAGVNRVPSETTFAMPDWQIKKNKKFLTFIKKINMSHVIATRYKFVVNFDSKKYEKMLNYMNIQGDNKELNENDEFIIEKKLNEKNLVNESFNSILKKVYDEGKSTWLFTELKF